MCKPALPTQEALVDDIVGLVDGIVVDDDFDDEMDDETMAMSAGAVSPFSSSSSSSSSSNSNSSDEGNPMNISDDDDEVHQLSRRCSRRIRVPDLEEELEGCNSHPTTGLQRYNSTSTLFISSTMANPNREAMIKAVAARILALNQVTQSKLDSEAETWVPTTPDVCTRQPSAPLLPGQIPSMSFYSRQSVRVAATETKAERARRISIAQRKYLRQQAANLDFTDPGRAFKFSLNNLILYMDYVFARAELSEDCLIIALVYLDRLLSNGGPKLGTRTWKPLIVTALMLASKVWDDLSMLCEDFSIISEYPVEYINAWEVAFLTGIEFRANVSASLYTQYYFQLRAECDTTAAIPHIPLSKSKARELNVLSSAAQCRVTGASVLRSTASMGGDVLRQFTGRAIFD